jgi:hypothetical protein
MFKFKRNEKKNRKVLRKLIKIGLILALIFWLLCMLLDLLNGWNMELDKLARLVNEQSQTINSLQYELDTVKAQNTVLDWRLSFAEAKLVNQTDLINDIAQHNTNPSWSSQGVISQPQMVEIESPSVEKNQSFKVFDKPLVVPATVAVFGKALFTILRLHPAIP